MKKFLIVALFMVGCAVSSKFDTHTLDQATTLKQYSLDLISHGTEPYAGYAAKVDSLKSQLESEVAYEEGKGTPNFMTRKQWELLISKEYLLGAFFEKWKKEDHLNPKYVEAEKIMIGNTFDQIIQLEGGKIK